MASNRPSADAPPSTAVVEAVAAAEGVAASDLDCVLADAVDPTALDALFAPGGRGDDAERGDAPRRGGTVEFTYCGYVVTVGVDGSVTVEAAD